MSLLSKIFLETMKRLSPHKTLVPLLLLCFAFANHVRGEIEETTIDYAQVNDLLMIVSGKARSTYVYAEAKLELKNPELSLSEIVILLRRNGDLIQDIGIGPAGELSLPVIPLDQMQDVTLSINQKKNDTTIGINFGIHPPSRSPVSYAKLFVVLEDINQFTNEIAGMASWFIRDKVKLKFQFDESAVIYVNSENKNYRYETDENLLIELKVKKGLIKEDPAVIFSVLPIGVGI